MKKTPREIAKIVVGIVVQYGTASIVNGIIKSNVNPERIDQKIGVAAASIALGGAVAHVTSKQSDRMIDELFDLIDKVKTNV